MERLVLDRNEIEKLLQGREGPVIKDLTRRAVKVTSGAKRRCPVDTGRLRQSIRWTLARDGRGWLAVVGSDVEYAAAVHEGVKAQTVTAHRGDTSYTMSVPARPGRPFLRDALRESAL